MFCRYHWEKSNHRCREHGYERDERSGGRGQGGGGRDEREELRGSEEENRQEEKAGLDSGERKGQGVVHKLNPIRWWNMKKSMNASLNLLKKIGPGYQTLLAKLRNEKDPVAMHTEISASLADVVTRREDVATRLDAAHNEIVRKKKLRDSAVGARRQTLEAELKTLLSNYQALQRRMTGLLETERVMNLAILRLEEDQDNRIPGISEDTLDDITDSIEESSGSLEDLHDAATDLEKAGVRSPMRDSFDLDDALAGFDEEIPAEAEFEGFQEEELPEEDPKKEKTAEEEG